MHEREYDPKRAISAYRAQERVAYDRYFSAALSAMLMELEPFNDEDAIGAIDRAAWIASKAVDKRRIKYRPPSLAYTEAED